MDFTPLNGHILVRLCEDPRRHGTVHVPGQASVAFAEVVALDPLSSQNAAIAPGDVVYFPASQMPPMIVLDDEKFFHLVHQGLVIGKATGITPVQRDNTLKKTPDLVVPNGKQLVRP